MAQYNSISPVLWLEKVMNKTELADNKLINLYLDQDDEAFEILYSRYKNAVYSYLNKLIPGQTVLVDDLFQQTWMKVVSKIDKYRDQQNFLAWVIRISRNLSIDHFRKEGRKKTTSMEGVEPSTSGLSLPSAGLENSELGQAIALAVETLPQEQREVFVLRQQNVSFKEIAVIQETTLNTTLGRMHYAVNKLRSVLKEWL
jgi:RNA polymerase sigma-70 factor, ECF subfamily